MARSEEAEKTTERFSVAPKQELPTKSAAATHPNTPVVENLPGMFKRSGDPYAL